MIQEMVNYIQKADQSLFERINGQWTHPFLDTFMPWMRTSENWVVFYIILLGYLFYKKGGMAIKWLLVVAITIALTDQISSFIFKPFIHRLRPCADPAMLTQVKLLIPACPSSFSFTSSHAANHFSLAIFIFISLRPLFRNYGYLFFIWAGIISYAQVYVGVHYPLDVLAGTIIGLLIGYASARIYLKWIPAI